MADRLLQKKQIAERLYSLVERAQQHLSPEEMEISGIKNISRKLGEFIGTPAMSSAWDYDALAKMDGPQLFRAISGAWDRGQRTNNGKLIIQKGGGKLKIKNPFTGEEKLKDTRPGTRVHHKVQVASIYRPIENLPIDRQIDLVEGLAERAFMVGNDPDNIVSLLDYTHEYAGDNAAHVWGDTVGRHFRANITPDMSFEEQLDALIETAVKPQYRDVIRATGPGTVEYAVNLQRSKDFQNITGKSIDNASPDDIKQFNQYLEDKKSLPLDKRDAFDESLVDPVNQRTYDIYRTHHENVASGQRTSGLGPLKGGQRKELDKILAGVRESGPNLGAYLTTLNNGQPVPSRGAARTALTNKVRASNALKMGYGEQFGGVNSNLFDLPSLIKNNKLGALLGAGLDRDAAVNLGQGNLVQAGLTISRNAAMGAAGEAVAKRVGGAVLKRLPAAAARFAGGTASTAGALAPAMALWGAYDIADGVVEGATGRGITQRVVDSGATNTGRVTTKPATQQQQATAQNISNRMRGRGSGSRPSTSLLMPTPVKSGYRVAYRDRES